MKRSPMPARKSYMPRGTSQLKQAPIKSASGKAVRKASKKSNPNAGLEALKKRARRRDGNCCVMCGVVVDGRPSNVHHRRNRGAGGSRAANVIANLITLCGTPTTGCHGDVTLDPRGCDAERYGWKLPTNGTTNPAEEPVLVAWLGWAWPAADGEWQVIPDVTAVRPCPYCRQSVPGSTDCRVCRDGQAADIGGSPSDHDMPEGSR